MSLILIPILQLMNNAWYNFAFMHTNHVSTQKLHNYYTTFHNSVFKNKILANWLHSPLLVSRYALYVTAFIPFFHQHQIFKLSMQIITILTKHQSI